MENIPRRIPLTDARIMIVDDDHWNLVVLEEILQVAGFRHIQKVTSAKQVLPLFTTSRPDTMLLDLGMPDMDGFSIMEQLMPRMPREAPVPILVLTGDDSPETRRRALGAGARDFVTKPFDPIEIQLRVTNLLENRALHLQLRNQNRLLEEEVRNRTQELEEAHGEILNRLALASEYRDDETGEHAQRVGRLAALIAEELGLSPEEIALIRQAAPLHDVGKIGIADAILLKPGKLTAEEFEEVKKHIDIGAGILSGSDVRLLQIAEEIALTHHERWDGTGYCGLSGPNIPLVGRIVALADVFDALTSDRPYKARWSTSAAIEEIVSQSGKQFDPDVVRAFIKIAERGSLISVAHEDAESYVDLRSA